MSAPPERLGERNRLPQQPDDRSRQAHDENEDVQAIHLLSQKKAPPGAQDLRPVGHLAILTRAPRMAGRSLMTHYVTRTYLLSSCGMGASSRSSRLPS